MSTYCFIIGKHPEISLAELLARYQDAELKGLADDHIILSLKKEIGQKEFDRLGGVIKVIKVLEKGKKNDLVSMASNILSDVYCGSKLSYGLSVYGFSERQLRFLLIKLKKQLKQKEIKSRFINKNFANISAAQYKSIKNKGVELAVVKNGADFLMGQVVGVQDIDAYSKRDFEKPERDMQMGMMPPKLAQILINLTGVEGVVWDPFCGGGTLVMEGLLMDRDMMGSDINPSHVASAKKNTDWLKKECNIGRDAKLFVHDATKTPESYVTNNQPEAIAFEGDLGLPHNQNIQPELLNNIIVQLTQLYVQFFNQLKEVRFNGPIVAALPYFKLKNGQDLMMNRLIDLLEKMGFKRNELLPESVKINDRFCLRYSREGQAVGRAIYKFILDA